MRNPRLRSRISDGGDAVMDFFEQGGSGKLCFTLLFRTNEAQENSGQARRVGLKSLWRKSLNFMILWTELLLVAFYGLRPTDEAGE